MPKRTDIRTILVLGSGPIVIGQGCEFDYSGVQACKSLKAEGFRVVLVNSNPATIMTDPAFSDRTYIEPITPEAVRKIIRKEWELAGREPGAGAEDAVVQDGDDGRGGAGVPGEDRAAGDLPAGVHAGGERGRDRVQQGGVPGPDEPRPGGVHDRAGADRSIGDRVEGVRAGG